MEYCNITTAIKQRGDESMQEVETKILETFKKVIPKLSKEEQQHLLWFGEGMAFKIEVSKSTA